MIRRISTILLIAALLIPVAIPAVATQQVSSKDVVLVADPATLGEMRPQLHQETRQRMLAEIAKDWTNVPLEQVEKALFELRIG